VTSGYAFDDLLKRGLSEPSARHRRRANAGGAA